MLAEVQIRTIAMDFWASLEHDIRYKADRSRLPAGINEEMLACAGKIAEIDRPVSYTHLFVDVDDTDWFAEAVYYCYQNSLLRGRSEMSFDPDAAMTRAELVTVLWRIAGSPNSDNVGKTQMCIRDRPAAF